jgi:hypothetical protein
LNHQQLPFKNHGFALFSLDAFLSLPSCQAGVSSTKTPAVSSKRSSEQYYAVPEEERLRSGMSHRSSAVLSPTVPAHAARPRRCAILACQMALRSQMGRFPALLYSDIDGVRLVSRNGNQFKASSGFMRWWPSEVNAFCVATTSRRTARGEGLFRLACENDLEVIVAKRKSDPYLPEHAQWLEIRNWGHSQWAVREKLFERERERSPRFSDVGCLRSPDSPIFRRLGNLSEGIG